MMKKLLVSAVAISVMISWAWAGSGPDVHEGQWEIVVEMEIPGMPMKMPPATFTQCITKESLAPQSGPPEQQCEIKDVKTTGNTVTWNVVCDAPDGQMTGSGKVIYEKEQMSGSMTMNAQGRQMISHFKGHRIGDCQ